MPARARRSAGRFMPAEEDWQRRARPQLRLHPRHDGAAQSACEPGLVGLFGEAARDVESVHALRPANRPHQAETEIAAVAEDQRTRRRLGECDLDMPKPVLGKARSQREELRTLPFGFKWLSLHTHRLRKRRDARVPKRLPHGPFRRSMLAQALAGALRLFASPARVDAPARGGLRQGRGRDGAPEARLSPGIRSHNGRASSGRRPSRASLRPVEPHRSPGRNRARDQKTPRRCRPLLSDNPAARLQARASSSVLSGHDRLTVMG